MITLHLKQAIHNWVKFHLHGSNTNIYTTTDTLLYALYYNSEFSHADNFCNIRYKIEEGTYGTKVLNTNTGKIVLDLGALNFGYVRLLALESTYIVQERYNGTIYKYDSVNDTFILQEQFNNISTAYPVFVDGKSCLFCNFNVKEEYGSYYIYDIDETGNFIDLHFHFGVTSSGMMFTTLEDSIIDTQYYSLSNSSNLVFNRWVNTYKYFKWEQITEFPCEKDVYVVTGTSAYNTKNARAYIHLALPLVKQKYSDEMYNNALELSRDILGEEEQAE